MPEYGSFCPISMSSEVLADRWTPLIVRELVLGNTRFNEIARCLPGISRSLLVQRLRHLERKGVVQIWPSTTGKGSEYHLTPAGKDLSGVMDAMGRWAVEWLFDEFQPQTIEPTTLMWWMHRRMDPSRFPPGRTVLEFEHTAPDRITIWLVLDRGEVSVCQQHPGFDSDVVVKATTPTLSAIFSGLRSWHDAVASGDLETLGPPRLLKALPTFFLWSPFGEANLARAERGTPMPITTTGL